MTTAQTNDYLAKTRQRVGLVPRPLAPTAWWRVPAEPVFDGPMPLESERELYRQLDGVRAAYHGEWGGYLVMAPVVLALVLAVARRRAVIA